MNKKKLDKVKKLLNSVIPELADSYSKADYVSAYMNYRRTVFRKARVYLKSSFLLKKKDILVEFAKQIGYIPLINGVSLEDQLIVLYLNGSNDHLKPNESDQFYLSRAWLSLRKVVFSLYDKVCMKCGDSDKLHIDHIKPRSKYPELDLEIDNMQILCQKCNISKSNRNSIDYRSKKHHLVI